MDNITRGKLDNRILVERDDELGVALRNLQAVQAIVRFDREEIKATERRSETRRKLDMVRLADGFESAVGESSKRCPLRQLNSKPRPLRWQRLRLALEN